MLGVIFISCLSLLPNVASVMPPTNPPWPPTYDLSESSITMQCNSTGFSSPERGGSFGIVSYDWSNDKADWAMQQPMDCEERLLTQAMSTKAANNVSRVFVYRNVVKALPWFKSVRLILDDPLYSGFFLKFRQDDGSPTAVSRCAAENEEKCSVFYHDQEQTPAVPTEDDPNPDGSCPPVEDGGCDCGTQPCGEYLFDHRNGTQLLSWLLENHILSMTAVGHPSIDGLFMDDFWCSDLICADSPTTPGCPCSDPVQGATEIDRNQQADMDLSDEDIRDLYLAWDNNMEQIQQAILNKNGYTWSLMQGQDNANAMPDLLTAEECAIALSEACDPTSSWQTSSKLFGITVDQNEPTQLEQDVAFFLLARGDYAWLGWGVWGMTWPFNPEPAHGELPPLPDGVPRPKIIDQDFGIPIERVCSQVEPGVFERKWSSGIVRLDCNNFEANLPN